MNVNDTARKIRRMEIRGALKIAISSAQALLNEVEASRAENTSELLVELEASASKLVATRPSAVSLPNAVNLVLHTAKKYQDLEIGDMKKQLGKQVNAFIKNNLNAINRISEYGANRINNGDTILTHCHSKTALGIIKKAWSQGKKMHVYCTETRPWQQGFLTAKELAKEKIPCTLIVDSAVRYFMKEIDKVIIGVDSVASNGAIVNKIGTSQVALAAHEARVNFYAAAETIKFSPETIKGDLIEIEERSPSEIINPRKLRGVKIRNPVFDVTPPEYIDLIITEKGVISPSAALDFCREFGWE